MFGHPTLELFVAEVATFVTCAILGWVLLAMANSHKQIMPLLVVTLHVAAGSFR